MKLCIALDMPTKQETLTLIKQIKNKNNIWLKVGLRAYLRDGKALLEEIKAIYPTSKIFLDLKLYDIPNTMADATDVICSLPIDMFNVHISAGAKALKQIKEVASHSRSNPIVLGVSALTSFDNDSFRQIYHQDITNGVLELSKIAFESKLDGVVCSVLESLEIKQNTQSTFLTLTPGIKLDSNRTDDQERVADIPFAKKQKSDFIVVGRPIYQSSDPTGIIEKILTHIEE